ncbi:hypothetical protein [Litoreibacter halocynthiae]|uniref:hypothetical protein n=1 Tax=Litoreibacter halocynthiae TaxID=1242689 RepID=UPI00248FAE84|nr:hypothetical protein [Litoreibacter halocynthiae]
MARRVVGGCQKLILLQVLPKTVIAPILFEFIQRGVPLEIRDGMIVFGGCCAAE